MLHRAALQRRIGLKPCTSQGDSPTLNFIDHIFVGHSLNVAQILVPRNSLSRFASDHLPLIADLELLPKDSAGSSASQQCAANY